MDEERRTEEPRCSRPDDAKREKRRRRRSPPPLPLPPFGVGVGVTVWCWCRCHGVVLVSTSRVGNRFGGSCSCNARTCTYRRESYTHAHTRTPVRAAACVQRRRGSTEPNVLYRPRYWSKYSDAFTYLKTRAGLMCRRNGQLSPFSSSSRLLPPSFQRGRGRPDRVFDNRTGGGDHFLPGDR